MLAPDKAIIRDPFEYEMGQVRKQRIWHDMLKYLWPAIQEKFFGRHYTPAELEEFQRMMRRGFDYYRNTTPHLTDEDFDKFMARLMPIIRTHRAFGLFVRDKRGEISPTYVPWALNALDKEHGPHYGKAMTMALGEGEDITGAPCEVTSADPHYFEHVTTGWGYIEARHRSLVARQCLAESHDALILGAGYLPELSPKFGGTLPKDLRILACDLDESIDRAALMAQHQDVHLDYRLVNMLDLLRDCAAHIRHRRFDTIIMDGVIYYNLDDIDDIFFYAMRCLRPGGHIVFDLLMLHPELINLRAVLDWGAENDHPLKLMPTKGAAKRLVRRHLERYPGVTIESSDAGLYRWSSALTFKVTKPLEDEPLPQPATQPSDTVPTSTDDFSGF